MIAPMSVIRNIVPMLVLGTSDVVPIVSGLLAMTVLVYLRVQAKLAPSSK